ncbi:hypothetical protein MKK65_08985, partial [Methylobacterium sp. J-001]|uniref:hypothetical protein n=1 Tax=Methylobacterium sp. J-001 TaxID=2836609 RepID=UPI001FBB9BFD
MIISDIYEILRSKGFARSKSEFSRMFFGSRNSLTMIERRGNISQRSFSRVLEILRTLGHTDLMFDAMVASIKARLPATALPSEQVFAASVVVPSAVDPIMAARELRGRGFPVRLREVTVGAHPDATIGDHIVETCEWSAPIEVVRPLVWLLSLEDGRDGKAPEARGDRREATSGGRSDFTGP